MKIVIVFGTIFNFKNMFTKKGDNFLEKKYNTNTSSFIGFIFASFLISLYRIFFLFHS